MWVLMGRHKLSWCSSALPPTSMEGNCLVSWVTREPREHGWGSRWTSDLDRNNMNRMVPNQRISGLENSETSCQVGTQALLAHFQWWGTHLSSSRPIHCGADLTLKGLSCIVHCPSSALKPTLTISTQSPFRGLEIDGIPRALLTFKTVADAQWDEISPTLSSWYSWQLP